MSPYREPGRTVRHVHMRPRVVREDGVLYLGVPFELGGHVQWNWFELSERDVRELRAELEAR